MLFIAPKLAKSAEKNEKCSFYARLSNKLCRVEKLSHSTTPFSSHDSSSDCKNDSILIVISGHREQSLVQEIFRFFGFYNLITVSSAQNAIRVLNTQHIDLLVCGVDLDDLDGWRLSRLVRSAVLKVNAELPIILLTDTWCERIAEVTAREFAIDLLVPVGKLDKQSVERCLNGRDQSKNLPTLLVVEDMVDTSDLVERVLGGQFNIQVAADGVEGLSAWLKNRHELVLLDLMLPNLSGRDVLEKIMEEDPGQPVVIMTANANAAQAEELMLIGASDFIQKPFRPAQIRKVCSLALRREDYLISHQQFATQVKSLADRERAYRDVNEKHQELLHNLQTVVMQLNRSLEIEFINYSWENLTGFSVNDSLGKRFVEFLDRKDQDMVNSIECALKDIILKREDSKDIELRLLSSSGEHIWVDMKVNRSNSQQGDVSLAICLDDITERKRAQEKLEYLAGHDSLTGLFNRHQFDETLKLLDYDARMSKTRHGLIYLDLDHFKVINDTFGHHQGDEVLREVAKIISKTISSGDTLCRLGGDEFAILVREVNSDQLIVIANRVQNAIGEYSFKAENHKTNLGCCIGISVVDGSVSSSEQYLMKADIALYVAKGRGRNLVHLYAPEDDESDELKNKIDWVAKVREAIKDNRLVMHFQPVLDVREGTIKYHESLVRMIGEDGNLIYPDSFIPNLENTGEIHLLDRHIIKLAITTLRQHPELKRIAINLSAQAFRDENLVPTIKESLYLTGVSAKSIIFELTESASLFNLNVTRRVITELNRIGCQFSIDDFGSGFSSFAYLKELPADFIKLDGSFIKKLDQDTTDQALVKSIIQVVQALGKETVAEYVENEQIYTLLKQFGIDFAQGYYIGRPVPVEDVNKKPKVVSLRSVS